MKIFIGSASESKQIANLLKRIVNELGHSAIVWTTVGLFVPSLSTLENLEKFASEYDAAIFIYSEDDYVVSRGVKAKTVRDNVVFEAGLFAGKMGHERVAICVQGSPKIPSDQSGLTTIHIYDNDNETESELNLWLSSIAKSNISKKSSNIIMQPRRVVDQDDTIENRWKYATEIMFVNYASTAFTAAQKVVPNHVANKSLRELYIKKLKSGCNFKFLITEPNTFADFDASYSKMNVVTNLDVEISGILQYSLSTLEKDCEMLAKYSSKKKGTLEYKTTSVALPYSLVLVTNDDEHRHQNYIKVDLYSPFLNDDASRRSFVVYPDNENYYFFYEQISTLWKKGDKNIKPQINCRKLSGDDIIKSINEVSHQCLVGNSNDKHSPALIYDKKLDISMSYYSKATSEGPYYHKYTTEFIYVLQGECKVKVKNTSCWEFVTLKKGDFYAIPKLTEYAMEMCDNTQLLLIRSPGIYDIE